MSKYYSVIWHITNYEKSPSSESLQDLQTHLLVPMLDYK